MCGPGEVHPDDDVPVTSLLALTSFLILVIILLLLFSSCSQLYSRLLLEAFLPYCQGIFVCKSELMEMASIVGHGLALRRHQDASAWRECMQANDVFIPLQCLWTSLTTACWHWCKAGSISDRPN